MIPVPDFNGDAQFPVPKCRGLTRQIRILEFIASISLLACAGIELIGALTGKSYLYIKDPILRVDNIYIVLIVSGIQGALGIAFFVRKSAISAPLLLWLSSCFSAYHFARYYFKIGAPCACLGGALDWSSWMSTHQKIIVNFLVFLWMVTALTLIFIKNRRYN